MTTGTLSDRRATSLWLVLLTAASTATTLIFACATPFPALAAIAATRMSRRDGVILMVVAWSASQAVGFCVLGYPHDAATLGWAAALCVAAVASVLAASTLDARSNRSPWVRPALAYVVAAVAFKAVILLFSLGLGGVDTALSPVIFARQLVRNAAILVGLLALYEGLVSLGMPALRSARPAMA